MALKLQGSGNWTVTRAGIHETESDLQPQMTNEVRLFIPGVKCRVPER